MEENLATNNKDKYFKGQQENEVFICFFRHHWIDLLKEFLYFGIFIFICWFLLKEIDTVKNVLRGNRELKILFFFGFLVGTAYLHRFFLTLLNFFVDIGIITNMRVVDHQKTLFFTDNLDSIDMSHIQNIEKVGEGILPTLLNYGDIKIFLSASDTVKVFKRVPNAKFHFRCINRQKEERQIHMNREQNGLGKTETQQQPVDLKKEPQSQWTAAL